MEPTKVSVRVSGYDVGTSDHQPYGHPCIYVCMYNTYGYPKIAGILIFQLC